MGTFLKYVFYIVVIVVVYLVARGIYDGSITEKTTVGQVVSDVDTGSKELVKDGYEATKKSIENMEGKGTSAVDTKMPMSTEGTKQKQFIQLLVSM